MEIAYIIITKLFGLVLAYLFIQNLAIAFDVLVLIRMERHFRSLESLSGHWIIVGFCLIMAILTGYFSYQMLCG